MLIISVLFSMEACGAPSDRMQDVGYPGWNERDPSIIMLSNFRGLQGPELFKAGASVCAGLGQISLEDEGKAHPIVCKTYVLLTTISEFVET